MRRLHCQNNDNLKKLKQASIELAQSLTLPELKKQKGYDEVHPENLQQIMERMITGAPNGKC